jgi:hypothetical protein
MAKAEIKTPKRISAAELAREEEIARLFKRQIIFWIGAAIIFGLFLYLFASILLPFIVGMTLAYFLDPVADRLERLGLSRMVATLTILISFIVIFVLALMIFVPILVSQLADFGTRLPQLRSAAAGTGRVPKCRVDQEPTWRRFHRAEKQCRLDPVARRRICDDAHPVDLELRQDTA